MRAWRATGVVLAATSFGIGILAFSPACAQDAQQLRAIQAQIASLQAQLRKLQREAAARDAALRKAQDDAANARAQASVAPPRATGVPNPPVSLATIAPNEEPIVLVHPLGKDGQPDLSQPTGKIRIGALTLTAGGFIELTGIYRSRNLTSGTGSPFNKIPFANDPNYYADEFRLTAQHTRLSTLLEANTWGRDKLTGYFEADFNGAGTTSNSVQTNSYTPRLREAFVQYDFADLGLHLLAGQAWSLATQVTGANGLNARSESVPRTIDTNYVPGFVYTRNPQVRLVQDFGPVDTKTGIRRYHVGFSLESPQSTFSVYPSTNSGSVLPPLSNQQVGSTVFYNNPGGSNLNSSANYSLDSIPDMILKASADPGWGHYEVYGLGRFFRSQSGIKAANALPTSNNTVFGGGVGGSITLPVVRNVLDLTGDVLGGYGIGRYGAAGLPDGTFQANGDPAPLPEIMGYVGLVGHATPDLDLYTYLGMDEIGRGTYNGIVNGAVTQVGYGATTVNNSGCATEGGTCNAQSRLLWNVSAGTWWRVLHGPWGNVQAGLQYSYTRRDAFRGAATSTTSVSPHTSDNMVFGSIRYTPFQAR